MLHFLKTLWDTSDFPARWHCGNWTSTHGWSHILSDILIFCAYMAIPIILATFLRKRRDIPFPRTMWLFVFFIAACGTTHLIEAVIFWHPIYRVSAAFKAATATVSWATVFALVSFIPRALAYKSPKELQDEVTQATEQLRRSNEELEQFAYVASHDLKAPIRAIGNLAHWIEEDLSPNASEQTREHLDLLKNRTHRIDNLLSALLDYCRIGSREFKATREDLSELLTDVVALLDYPDAFRINWLAPLPVVMTKRPPLEQVLLNLISNAIKHRTQDEGQVTIRVSQIDGNFLCFKVQDDGPGIDPQYHERIFQMFQTLKPRDEMEGAGMGLAIVRKIIESHGGTIDIESNLGRGTLFTFSWPARLV